MRISDWSSDVCSSDLVLRQDDGIALRPGFEGGIVELKKRIYVVGYVIAAPSERSIACERQGEGGIGPRQIFEHAIYDCTVHARDTLVIHTTTRGQKQRFVRIKADNECFTQARWRRHAISRECRCQYGRIVEV